VSQAHRHRVTIRNSFSTSPQLWSNSSHPANVCAYFPVGYDEPLHAFARVAEFDDEV
jgi:hypothetical protein